MAAWLKRSHSASLTKDLRPVYWTSLWAELKHTSRIVQGDSNGVMENGRIFPNHRPREREFCPQTFISLFNVCPRSRSDKGHVLELRYGTLQPLTPNKRVFVRSYATRRRKPPPARPIKAGLFLRDAALLPVQVLSGAAPGSCHLG